MWNTNGVPVNRNHLVRMDIDVRICTNLHYIYTYDLCRRPTPSDYGMSNRLPIDHLDMNEFVRTPVAVHG